MQQQNKQLCNSISNILIRINLVVQAAAIVDSAQG